jgi:hypothetical protein
VRAVRVVRAVVKCGSPSAAAAKDRDAPDVSGGVLARRSWSGYMDLL